ncbi:unnamed protein product [Ilex paraguariensis]|uniref:Pectinesterase inhibitor domain-containing protein n=1 Tax=Ilex paraguariensis TaxID=185542 RepID=A0ABC8R631_9AQUA
MKSTNSKVNLLDGQSSKSIPNKTQTPLIVIFLISLFILLALVIGALSATIFVKKSNLFNPAESIRYICSVTPYRHACFKTLYSIAQKTTTPIQSDPHQIFTLFLQLAIQELTSLTSLPKNLISKTTNDPRTESAFRDCMSLGNLALSQLNRSLASINVDTGLAEEKINDVTVWINGAEANQQNCLYELQGVDLMATYEVSVRLQRSMQYTSNSLAILVNKETILDKFNPLKQLFKSGLEYMFSVFVFGSRYLVLIFLFCLLLRI